jgi:hypothetical protein
MDIEILAVEIFKYLRPSFSQYLYVHRSRYAGTQQQLNTWDCGMFMLGHAEAIVMGGPIAFTQIDIPVLRKRMVLALTRDFAATFGAVPLAVPAAASTSPTGYGVSVHLKDYLQLVHLASCQKAARKGAKYPPDTTLADMRHRLVKCGVLTLHQLWESEHLLKKNELVPDWMFWSLYNAVPRNSG